MSSTPFSQTGTASATDSRAETTGARLPPMPAETVMRTQDGSGNATSSGQKPRPAMSRQVHFQQQQKNNRSSFSSSSSVVEVPPPAAASGAGTAATARASTLANNNRTFKRPGLKISVPSPKPHSPTKAMFQNAKDDDDDDSDDDEDQNNSSSVCFEDSSPNNNNNNAGGGGGDGADDPFYRRKRDQEKKKKKKNGSSAGNDVGASDGAPTVAAQARAFVPPAAPGFRLVDDSGAVAAAVYGTFTRFVTPVLSGTKSVVLKTKRYLARRQQKMQQQQQQQQQQQVGEADDDDDDDDAQLHRQPAAAAAAAGDGDDDADAEVVDEKKETDQQQKQKKYTLPAARLSTTIPVREPIRRSRVTAEHQMKEESTTTMSVLPEATLDLSSNSNAAVLPTSSNKTAHHRNQHYLGGTSNNMAVTMDLSHPFAASAAAAVADKKGQQQQQQQQLASSSSRSSTTSARLGEDDKTSTVGSASGGCASSDVVIVSISSNKSRNRISDAWDRPLQREVEQLNQRRANNGSSDGYVDGAFVSSSSAGKFNPISPFLAAVANRSSSNKNNKNEGKEQASCNKEDDNILGQSSSDSGRANIIDLDACSSSSVFDYESIPSQDVAANGKSKKNTTNKKKNETANQHQQGNDDDDDEFYVQHPAEHLLALKREMLARAQEAESRGNSYTTASESLLAQRTQQNRPVASTMTTSSAQQQQLLQQMTMDEFSSSSVVLLSGNPQHLNIGGGSSSASAAFAAINNNTGSISKGKPPTTTATSASVAIPGMADADSVLAAINAVLGEAAKRTVREQVSSTAEASASAVLRPYVRRMVAELVLDQRQQQQQQQQSKAAAASTAGVTSVQALIDAPAGIVVVPLRRLPLTFPPSERSTVRQAIGHGKLPEHSRVCTVAGHDLTAKDFVSLLPSNWLNDNVINAYTGLLVAPANVAHRKMCYRRAQSDVVLLNSHFFTRLKNQGISEAQRWVAAEDIFAARLLLIPINDSNVHWTLMTVEVAEQRLSYYDSMGADGQGMMKLVGSFLSRVWHDRQRLRRERRRAAAAGSGGSVTASALDCAALRAAIAAGGGAARKARREWVDYVTPLPPSDPVHWRCFSAGRSTPQQVGTVDCGVFTCQTAAHLVWGVDLWQIDQSRIVFFRELMALELLRGKLLPRC